MNFKTIVGAGFIALALLASSACSSADDKSTDAGEHAEDWLFALQSTGESSFDRQTGTLALPVDSVLAFTDRPNRLSDAEGPESFVELWNEQDPESFSADPPNIVITWWPSNGGYAESIDLATIAGDVAYDSTTRLLKMHITTDGSAPLDLPSTMAQVSLFVDGLSANCPGGSGTVSGNGKSSPICVTTKQF